MRSRRKLTHTLLETKLKISPHYVWLSKAGWKRGLSRSHEEPPSVGDPRDRSCPYWVFWGRDKLAQLGQPRGQEVGPLEEQSGLKLRFLLNSKESDSVCKSSYSNKPFKALSAAKSAPIINIAVLSAPRVLFVAPAKTFQINLLNGNLSRLWNEVYLHGWGKLYALC